MQFSYITTFFALAASMAMANPVPAEVSDLEDRQSSGRCCATGFAVVDGQTLDFFVQVPQGTGGIVNISPLSGCTIGVARATGCGGFSIASVGSGCGTGRSVSFESC